MSGLKRSLARWMVPAGVFYFAAVSFAVEANPLIAQADAVYAKREDIPQAKIAMLTYERAAASGGAQAVEGYWKASRAAWWLGENEQDHPAQLEYFQTAMRLAQKAVDLDPRSVEAHFWLGATAGCYGKYKGVLTSLSLVKPIRHEMGEVIRLNDHFMDGAAYRILGVVDYKVPGLFGGSIARARQELEKAAALGPSDPFVLYDYVDFYKHIGDGAKSKAALENLRALKVPPELIPELKLLQRKAQAL